MRRTWIWLVISLCGFPATATGAPHVTVLDSVAATDRAWDDGSALVVTWQSRLPEAFSVRVMRHGRSGDSKDLGRFPSQQGEVVDAGLSPDQAYVYELTVVDEFGNQVSVAATGGFVSPQVNWFDRNRTGEGLIILLVFAVILVGTFTKGSVFVRPISGLSAMEDAIGRAVEMGKPILFSAGWGAQLDKPTTMAAMNIFGWLARKSAAYEAELRFPAHDAVIMAAAQEAAQEAALTESRPHWYRPDNIYYITGSQFGYAAALDGIMERERPAANLWLGTFAAESLILAETGNHIGAVQIAGTDSTIQLAFFLVTCDYTLIGEEVFAASAYLTRDPQVLGGLWAQDMLKIAVWAALAAGLVGTLVGWTTIGDWLRAL